MKIAILWTQMSGYLNACLKALAEVDNVELFVINNRTSTETPFDENIFSWIGNRYQWDRSADANKLISHLDDFCPDVILCANWHNKSYRKTLKHFKGKTVRIFTSDRPWLGTPRQWLGVFISSYYLHPVCEAIFVSGARQVIFAKKMGFTQERIITGLYSCDHEKFSQIYLERKKLNSEPHSFVFIGRFSPEKGLDTLVEAYVRYHKNVADPWTLKCYGTGALQHLIDGIEGIEYKGFCQPDDLPRELLQASCLILPSNFEPWGLVVHEATTAGMGIIVSDAVGASVHLVQDNYNGYIVETGSVDGLVNAMLRYTSLSKNERSIMGDNSYLMSLQFTPKRWADTLLIRTRELMANKNARR